MIEKTPAANPSRDDKTVVIDPVKHDGVRRKFERLAGVWKQQSEMLSSPMEMAMLPAYQQIIGMGQNAVPYLLSELKREPDFWFWALRAITEEDPVSDSDQGDVEKMAKAWLDWGTQRVTA